MLLGRRKCVVGEVDLFEVRGHLQGKVPHLRDVHWIFSPTFIRNIAISETVSPIVQALRFVSEFEGRNFSCRDFYGAACTVALIRKGDRNVINSKDKIVI